MQGPSIKIWPDKFEYGNTNDLFGNVTRSLLIPVIVGAVAGFIDIVEGP